MESIEGKRFFTSWSGGKDACLATWRMVRAGGLPRALLTICREDGARSRSHGLSPAVLRAQADALGLPLHLRAASWSDYEEEFVDALRALRASGIEAGVFGDIEGEAHRGWVERVCARADIEAHLPLWGNERRALVGEFIEAGFEARLVVARQGHLEAGHLGRRFDTDLLAELRARGVDVAGEGGEFHTVVTGGPLFRSPISLREGRRELHSGCFFLELEAAEADSMGPSVPMAKTNRR
ncbi:diphthine--ammonia ligase [Vulgatibacter sp.]|uniref:Dph6-related ATP pyrophosphatase n=1 Tax=Vulgatibacter sp. TaxID=1971226 RepID=UPI0035670C7B